MSKRYAWHPSLLETGSFTLTIPGTKLTAAGLVNLENVPKLEIKLFVDNPCDPSTRLYLSVTPIDRGRVSVSVSKDLMGFSNDAKVLSDTDAIVCNFRIVDSDLIANLNGLELYREKVKLSTASSRGVAIALNDKLSITSIRQENSYSVRNAFIHNESREVALTEPRFVLHQPARSLLVGRNSDLWRADIVSMNDDTVTVRSGGRHLAIERSLVSSLLWPDLPPVEETPPESRLTKPTSLSKAKL